MFAVMYSVSYEGNALAEVFIYIKTTMFKEVKCCMRSAG